MFVVLSWYSIPLLYSVNCDPRMPININAFIVTLTSNIISRPRRLILR